MTRRPVNQMGDWLADPHPMREAEQASNAFKAATASAVLIGGDDITYHSILHLRAHPKRSIQAVRSPANPSQLGFSRSFAVLCASQHRKMRACLDTVTCVADHSFKERAIDRVKSVRSVRDDSKTKHTNRRQARETAGQSSNRDWRGQWNRRSGYQAVPR